jgi:hypothetical protein
LAEVGSTASASTLAHIVAAGRELARLPLEVVDDVEDLPSSVFLEGMVALGFSSFLICGTHLLLFKNFIMAGYTLLLFPHAPLMKRLNPVSFEPISFPKAATLMIIKLGYKWRGAKELPW